MTQIARNYVIFVCSILYGAWVYFIVEYWSFDYSALVDSVEYYRTVGYNSFFELLFNNTVLLVFWDAIFVNCKPEFVVSLLFGFAASLRFYVLFTTFQSRLVVPVFLATSVQLDLNQCRYSLAISITLLLIPYIKRFFLALLVFPVHLLAPAWIVLLTPPKHKFFILVVLLLFLTIAPEYFTRHFAELGDAFPRIALVYSLFVLVLIMVFHNVLKLYIFNYLLICVGVAFVFIQGNVINFAYFFRLADLMFQTILVHLLIARTSGRDRFVFSYLQTITLATILAIAIVYSYVLIGGNIWRFF